MCLNLSEDFFINVFEFSFNDPTLYEFDFIDNILIGLLFLA